MDANTKTYVVTELAGPKVAGRRVTKSMELQLTEEEARSELLEGAIVEKGKGLHRAFTEKTAKSEKALEAAALPALEEPAAPGEAAPGEAAAPAPAKPAKGPRPA